MATGISNIRKGWRGIWKEFPVEAAELSDRVLTVTDYGALSDDGTTDNTIPIQNCVNDIGTTGGTIIFPPAGLTYGITDPIVLLNKKALVIEGFGQHSVNATSGYGFSACVKVDPSWGTTDAMFHITANTDAYANAKGGILFSGMYLWAGIGVAAGGYAIHLDKGTLNTDFWGDITLNNSAIINANIGLFIDDSAGGGSGFGWIKLFQSRIQGCVYGIRANCTVNDFNVIDCIIRQNQQASNSNYTIRTGGGIVLNGGTKVLILGNTLEGQQVGVHAVAITGLDIRNNYLEVMYDAAYVIRYCKDVVIEANYHTSHNNGRHIFVENSARVRQEKNSQSYFICAQMNRDLVTDTPKLTRFTTENNGNGSVGTQTLDDYGWWVQSIPAHQPSQDVPRSSNVAMQTFAATNATLAAHAGSGPDGVIGKCLEVTAGAALGHIDLRWLSSGITIAEGQWVVISVRLKAPTTNVGTNCLYFQAHENINGGGTNLMCENTLDASLETMVKGEWVTFQWFHKVLAGETTYLAALNLYIPTNGDKLIFGGAALNVVDQPAIKPMYGLISCESDATEFQYFLNDGTGNYYSAAAFASAKPTGSLITWQDGEKIWTTAPVTVTQPGYVCTTTGTGGGTARFAAMVAVEAEAA